MSSVTVHSFTSEAMVSKAADFCAQLLLQETTKNPVLLLLSGGSAIQMYAQLFLHLELKKIDGNKLAVSLLDERFVSPSSTDSTGFQLAQAGVLKHIQSLSAQWWPYLKEKNETGPEIATRVSLQFTKALGNNYKLIIFAGIGEDGHTAGLLPTNDPITQQNIFQSLQFVQFYQLPTDAVNPFRERLTCTPKLLEHASEIVIYATGTKKQAILEKFVDANAEVTSRFPALCLKKGTANVTLLTDTILQKAQHEN